MKASKFNMAKSTKCLLYLSVISNPFNPTTQISYELPGNSYVAIEVFNMLGQKVATLVNEYQSAGTHEIYFDAAKLSSGIYIYQLQTGKSIQTKKMTLTK